MFVLMAPVAFAACSEQSPTAVVAADVDQGSAIMIMDPPPASCTYTQGYWKQHPELWDEAGDAMAFLTTDLFYNSMVGNLTLMKMPPKGGNAYEILAHQYIAALLNLNGATPGVTEVDNALTGAAAYFSAEATGIPNPVDPTRSQLQQWATTLDQFNNGIIGPGHCS